MMAAELAETSVWMNILLRFRKQDIENNAQDSDVTYQMTYPIPGQNSS